MNLLINGSNREKNNYNILKDLQTENDELISLANKDIKFCLGCNSCIKKLDNYCILDDYITNEIYPKLIEAKKIILASPLYISQITGLLKTLIDRFYPFYNLGYFKDKQIYLILTGHGTEEENKDEIQAIINYFQGVSEWMPFNFKFLSYFTSGDIEKEDDVKLVNKNYYEKIDEIKKILNN